jgi:HTH-type transcriptional regulator / antitoxin HipB
MALTPQDIGTIVRKTRKQLGVTQKALALTSGTGSRFITDLENGKVTCQIGKTLSVLQTLGIRLELIPPQTPSLSDRQKTTRPERKN